MAVPDGFHPSAEYVDGAKPGGSGSCSDDHKVLYSIKLFLMFLERPVLKLICWSGSMKKGILTSMSGMLTPG